MANYKDVQFFRGNSIMATKQSTEEATRVCFDLWDCISTRNWESARKLLSDDFEAHWPQSQEILPSPEAYIEVNRTYPGEHKIQFLNSMCEYDQWELSFSVSTQVQIESKMPDGRELKLFAISFFEVDSEGLISSATEYWAETYIPPVWRQHFVKIDEIVEK